MLFLILAVLIFIVVFVTLMVQLTEVGGVKSFWIFLYIFMTLLGIYLLYTSTSMRGSKYIIEKQEIVSLERNNTTTGIFFLGIGKIENSTYYFFYRKKKNGLILDRTPSYKTLVIETNIKQPCLIKKFKYLKSSYKKIGEKNIVERKLYVPKNTIKKEFVL